MRTLYDEEGNPVEIDDTSTSKLDTIIEKLNASDETANQKLAEILADPDYQKVLEAKEKGGEIVISKGKKDPVIEDEPVDLDELDNRGLVSHIEQKLVSTLEKKLEEKLTPVKGSLEDLNKVAQTVQQTATRKEADRLRGKYSDFDNYKDDIITLHNTHPTLTLEQLYTLASAGKEKPIPTQELGTERPGSTVHRAAPKKRDKPRSPGRKGIKEMIREGASIGVDKALADNPA